MNPDRKKTHVSDTSAAVLLIFMPVDATLRPSVQVLIERLRGHLGTGVRVMKLDEAVHPDIFRSFEITQLPTFVLIRQGIELWRQEGLPETTSPSVV
ncbi:thioredoxin family protein [Rudanella lutea]|uniref:thioredoxin family protein n=1 Tax=Rudanella lutea TaxID=451374 RepID=UPI00035F00D8|nr:thioredoxin family protein [Rudanella lutea]